MVAVIIVGLFGCMGGYSSCGDSGVVVVLVLVLMLLLVVVVPWVKVVMVVKRG